VCLHAECRRVPWPPNRCTWCTCSSQVEKEVLSLIFNVQKYHQYIYGREFTFVTDHRPLTTIFGPKKGVPPLAAARLQRWALLLSAYRYNTEFKPTLAHGNADGLSWLPFKQEAATGNPPDPAVFNVRQLNVLPVMSKRLAAALAQTLSWKEY